MEQNDRKYLLNRIETLFKAQSALDSMARSSSNEQPAAAEKEIKPTLNNTTPSIEEEWAPVTSLPKRDLSSPAYFPLFAQKETGPEFQATGVSIQLPVPDIQTTQNGVAINVSSLQGGGSRRGSVQQPGLGDKSRRGSVTVGSRRGSIQQGPNGNAPDRKASIKQDPSKGVPGRRSSIQQGASGAVPGRRPSIQSGHSRQSSQQESESQGGSILQAMASRRQSISAAAPPLDGKHPSTRSSTTKQPKLLSVVNTVRKKSIMSPGGPGGASASNEPSESGGVNMDASISKQSSFLSTPEGGAHRPSALQSLKSKIKSKIMPGSSEQSSLNSSASIRESKTGDQWGGVLQQMRQNALVTKFKSNLESNVKGPTGRRGSVLEGSNFPVNSLLKSNGGSLSESGHGGSFKRNPSTRRGWGKLKGAAIKSVRQDESEELKEEMDEVDDLLSGKQEEVVVKVEHIHDSNRARLHWLLFLYAALRSNRIKLIKPSTPVKPRSMQSFGKRGSISVPATPTARPAKTPLLLSSEEDAALAEMPFLAPSDKPTMTVSIQMQEIFKVPKGQRMEKELAILEQSLGKTRFFSKYPPHLRAKLYNMCSYQTYAKGTRLIREGHLPDSCYVLILGECAQYTEAGLRQIVPTILSHTEQGFLIGDLANHVPGEKRSYSVICVMRSSLLSISKTDWMQITREAKSYETYQFDIICSLPLLKDLPKMDISRLSSKGYVFNVDANSFFNSVHSVQSASSRPTRQSFESMTAQKTFSL
jgi:hypothetical protein